MYVEIQTTRPRHYFNFCVSMAWHLPVSFRNRIPFRINKMFWMMAKNYHKEPFTFQLFPWHWQETNEPNEMPLLFPALRKRNGSFIFYECETAKKWYNFFLVLFICVECRNGRPGTSSISEKHKIDWGTYMSSHNDVIYIRLDVRGSKGQSKRALYRHLGGVEVQDQIDALR